MVGRTTCCSIDFRFALLLRTASALVSTFSLSPIGPHATLLLVTRSLSTDSCRSPFILRPAGPAVRADARKEQVERLSRESGEIRGEGEQSRAYRKRSHLSPTT